MSEPRGSAGGGYRARQSPPVRVRPLRRCEFTAADGPLEVVDGLAQLTSEGGDALPVCVEDSLRLIERRLLHAVPREQVAEVALCELVVARLEDRRELLEVAVHVRLEEVGLHPPVEAAHRGAGQVERAEAQGYSIVEPTIVVILHLTEIIRQNADELLTRQHVHELIGALKDRAPKLVEEVNPDQLKMSHVHQVLKNLLSERVPVRDLETILQTTIDNSDRISNLAIMTEYVRTALARTICQKFRDLNRRIHLVSLDPVLEDYLRTKMDFDQFGVGTKLTPQESEAILEGLKVELKKLTDLGLQPVVITTAPQIRAGLRQMTSRALPKLAVLCLNEITPETQIVSRGYVSAEVLRSVLMTQAEG